MRFINFDPVLNTLSGGVQPWPTLPIQNNNRSPLDQASNYDFFDIDDNLISNLIIHSPQSIFGDFNDWQGL